MDELSNSDFEVTILGKRRFESPLGLSTRRGDGIANYVPNEARILYHVTNEGCQDFDLSLFMERAGPRQRIFFDPERTRAAVVTCGGLSPGLNNVIRSIFLELHHKYRVPELIGFRYGFSGMNPGNGIASTFISPEFVRNIHNEGGSVLGCSRGYEDPAVIVDTLDTMGINILFAIGGDGTLRGAHAIWEEVRARGKDIAVVGVPKTIDNDISFVYKTFGFDTAVGIVRDTLSSAHAEAVGAPNGVGLVRVMGRDSGFIAAYATLASSEVNFCLIPEVPFDLHGKGGLLDLLEQRMARRGHAVILVAEGAGQHLFEEPNADQDASGNVHHHDIGLFLKDEIKRHFAARNLEVNMKYIDPSYIVRSVRANASDAIFCENLARNAVHAGMAGTTDVVIGLWHGVYVHLPIDLVTRHRKKIHPESYLWRNVVGATGQPMDIRAAG